MSQAYIARLRRIDKSYQASLSALSYTTAYFNEQSLQERIGETTQHQLRSAVYTLEEAYVVRIFAEFEGILKQHLSTNHPMLKVRSDARVGYLLARVLKTEQIALSPVLFSKFELLRDTRNNIAHQNAPGFPMVSFSDARDLLARILDKLPEPYQA